MITERKRISELSGPYLLIHEVFTNTVTTDPVSILYTDVYNCSLKWGKNDSEI